MKGYLYRNGDKLLIVGMIVFHALYVGYLWMAGAKEIALSMKESHGVLVGTLTGIITGRALERAASRREDQSQDTSK